MADDGWSCPACTLRNELTAEACDACGATSPLVLESYACEAQAQASAAAASPTAGNAAPAPTLTLTETRGDPWAMAECEWAGVEAVQEQRVPRRK